MMIVADAGRIFQVVGTASLAVVAASFVLTALLLISRRDVAVAIANVALRRDRRIAPGKGSDVGGIEGRKARTSTFIGTLKGRRSGNPRIEGFGTSTKVADEPKNGSITPQGDVESARSPRNELNPARTVDREWERKYRPIPTYWPAREMRKRVGDFMAVLGGGNQAILKEVPQERSRFVQMAGVLLTTAGIAAVSMFFALHNGVKTPLVATVIASLLWGIIILNIDRFLVLSMGSVRDRWRLVWMTLPRLAMALMLALVISTPLVLRIFASDINAQIFTMQQEQSRQMAALVTQSQVARQADQVQREISASESVLAGHLPQSITSPQLQTAQAKVSELEAQAQSDHQAVLAARRVWQCQVSGQTCAGGTGTAGNGPQARAKYRQYQKAVKTFNSTAAKLIDAQNAVQSAEAGLAEAQKSTLRELQNQARQNLPALHRQYNVLAASLQNETAYANKVNRADTGLLVQLQALTAVSSQNASLEAARLVVLALFVFIEILPVTVKFLLNLGPPSTYEVVAKLKEDEIIDLAQVRRIERLRIAEGGSQARLSVESDMRRREEDLGRRANESVGDEELSDPRGL